MLNLVILEKFFRYANSKLNARHNVGPLRKSDGELTTDPAIKAELLSTYFSCVFTTDNGSCVTASENKTSGNISNITFTEQQVSRAISKLKANSVGGPDDIPPLFSKTVVLTLLLHWHLCTSCFSILPTCR